MALVSLKAKISQVDSSACISVLSFNTTSLLAGNPKSANYKEEADDIAKVAYIKEAVMPGSAALFEANKLVAADLAETLEWFEGKSTSEIMNYRENAIRAIEELATTLKKEGKVKKWLDEARDDKVRRISENINGPLLEILATKIQYHDQRAIELFREGAPIVGILPRTGLGKPVSPVVETTLAQLNRQREAKNKHLINSLSEDSNAQALLEACKEDEKKGRMLPVQLARNCDITNTVLSPRFAVHQGV